MMSPDSNPKHCVTIACADGSFSIEADSSDTVLSNLLRAGIGVPYECSAGGCGSCKFTLVEGDLNEVIASPPGLRASDHRKNKRLACTCRPTVNCVIRLKPDPDYVPAIQAVRFDATLVSKTAVTHDMVEFRFHAIDPPEFLPGQYSKITLPNHGLARNYSMSNISNSEGTFSFVIRRVPGGEATTALFDQDLIGQVFSIDGPYSVAHLDADSPRRSICVAGGSGLAPMVSIIRGLQNDPDRIETARLFYGARSEADLLPKDYLADIRGFDPVTQFETVLSDANDASWDGPTGFVHEYLQENLDPDCSEIDFYIAGPPVMVDAVRRVLILDRQVPIEQLKYDRFF